MKVPEKEEEKIKKYLGKKKIAKSFPYLMKDINLQIQEFQQTPSRMSTKKTSQPSYWKPKKKIKQPKKTHTGGNDLITAHFSSDNGSKTTVQHDL